MEVLEPVSVGWSWRWCLLFIEVECCLHNVGPTNHLKHRGTWEVITRQYSCDHGIASATSSWKHRPQCRSRNETGFVLYNMRTKYKFVSVLGSGGMGFLSGSGIEISCCLPSNSRGFDTLQWVAFPIENQHFNFSYILLAVSKTL